MPFYPIHLAPFLLLLLVPILALVTWKSLSQGPGYRKWTALVLRCGLLFVLVLALADLRVADSTDRLTVIFLLDQSASIPPQERDRSLARVRTAAKTRRPGDMAGLVVFGRNASIERVPDVKPTFRKISSLVTTDYTDVGQAIRLASAAFPEGTQRRLVLVSDGNENMGDALGEARRAAGAGITIDVLPVTYGYTDEVQVERIVVPSRVKRGETFEARIILTATRETRGKVFLTLNRTLVNEPKPVALTRGKNVLIQSLALDRPGFYSFLARVEAERDTLPGNNRGYGFTIVEGDPRVLLVGGKEEDVKYMAEALISQGIKADAVTPAGAPLTPAEFQSFDCLVIANVHARMFTPEQMEAIRSSVVNFGLGLVMVGGEEAFGAGGYYETPIEDALPVSCEVKQKKILPNGALVLVLHTCEFNRGNYWAKRIGQKAIATLTDEDLVGVVYFAGLGGGCQWLFEGKLVPAKDRDNLSAKLEGISPGDMPDFAPGLRMAYLALKDAPAAKKHIVVISDGDPSPPGDMLVRGMARTSVAVTTVLINPHKGDANAKGVMNSLARSTGGRFYLARSGQALPSIITRVARRVSTNFIKEKPFTPLRASASEILKGFPDDAWPALNGRVVTSMKPGAEIALKTPDGDPLFAHWRAGLGRSAAFTSDAKNRWGSAWVGWSKFAQFWAQTVRWCMRTVSRNNFNLEAHVAGGVGVVTLDALDGAGRFVNYLRIKSKVVSPSFKEVPLRIIQKGPGRYQGRFKADEVGSYYVSLLYEGEGLQPGFMATGASLSYSPEYRELSTNHALLSGLVEVARGRLLEPEDDAFLHNLPRRLGMEPQWPLLIVLAMVLLFVDVFFRRVSIPYERALVLAGAAARRTAGLFSRRIRDAESSEAMSALLRKKTEITEEREESRLRSQLADAPPPDGSVSLDKPGDSAAPGEAARPAPSEAAEESLFTKRLLDAKKKAFDKKKEKGTEP